MAKRYPGLYLYFDWLEGIEAMGRDEGYRMVLNLYHYVKDGKMPEPLKGSNNIVQNMCIAQLKRSELQSIGGKMGAEQQKMLAMTAAFRDMPLNGGRSVDPDDDPEELALLQSALHPTKATSDGR